MVSQKEKERKETPQLECPSFLLPVTLSVHPPDFLTLDSFYFMFSPCQLVVCSIY